MDLMRKGPGIKDEYELLDSGDGKKYETFGKYRLIRPCAQAIWKPRLSPVEWNKADAIFDRNRGNRLNVRTRLPDEWVITVSGIRFRLSITDFGHLGIFPEQAFLWEWITQILKQASNNTDRTLSVLNLFAYSGGATIAAARAGAQVRHLDASKGMVKWARDNASLNRLDKAPIHWIVDDVNRFLDREIRRKRRYDAIILDPPTYGHGKNKEVYKIEHELASTLDKCARLLSDEPVFILLSSHTPFCTPVALSNFLRDISQEGIKSNIECGEMLLEGSSSIYPVPNGTFARWIAKTPKKR